MRNRLTYLVPFSGGLDSTYLVWKLLEDGHKVFTVYFNIQNNETKNVVELAHRSLIVDKFRSKYNERFTDLGTTIDVTIHNRNCSVFSQPPVWIFGLLYNITQDIDRVAIGYVCGDHAISFIDDIKNLYDSMLVFQHENNKSPILEFPLKKKLKKEIYAELSSELCNLVYSCESPVGVEEFKTGKGFGIEKFIKYQNCGCCDPCKKNKDIRLLSRNETITINITKKTIKRENSEDKLTKEVESEEVGKKLKKKILKSIPLKLKQK